jgi:hypothetical protein
MSCEMIILCSSLHMFNMKAMEKCLEVWDVKVPFYGIIHKRVYYWLAFVLIVGDGGVFVRVITCV